MLPEITKTRELDRIDVAILEYLQENGRLPNVELARRVHLSPSSCLERVKRLENAGFIRGYHAKLDESRLGYGTTAYIQVTLARGDGQLFERFNQAVITVSEIAECQLVAGDFDYLLKIRISGPTAYQDLVTRIADLPGVTSTHTYLAVQYIKENQGIPLHAG